MSQQREQQQRDRIEQEHDAERHRSLLLIGLDGRSHRSNRTSPADCGPRCDQMRHFAAHMKPPSDNIAENQYRTDRSDRKPKSLPPDLQGAMDIHTETKSDDRCLQQHAGRFTAQFRERMPQQKCKKESPQQRDRCRQIRRCAQYDTEKEQGLARGGRQNFLLGGLLSGTFG